MKTIKEKLMKKQKLSNLELRVKEAAKYSKCVIYTDSQVALQKLSKSLDYMRHNAKATPKDHQTNLEAHMLETQINNIIQYMKEQGISTEFRKVKAHAAAGPAEHNGNHLADFLANLAVTGQWLPPAARTNLPRIDEEDPADLCPECKPTWTAASKQKRIETRTAAQKYLRSHADRRAHPPLAQMYAEGALKINPQTVLIQTPY